MRSYIFTPRERQVIAGFLRGEVRASEDVIRQVVIRMRSFRDLAGDIELYLEVRRRLAEPEAARSADEALDRAGPRTS
jgi:hypothetical protein